MSADMDDVLATVAVLRDVLETHMPASLAALDRARLQDSGQGSHIVREVPLAGGEVPLASGKMFVAGGEVPHGKHKPFDQREQRRVGNRLPVRLRFRGQAVQAGRGALRVSWFVHRWLLRWFGGTVTVGAPVTACPTCGSMETAA